MNDNDTLKKAILVAIGFIIGYAAHAFLTPEAVVPADDDVVIDTEIATTSVSEKKDETPKKVNEEEMGIASRDTQRFATMEFDAVQNNLTYDGYVASVNNQSSGSVVYMSALELPKESWVAVREDVDGQLGNILGARKYPAGSTTGVIELIRGTETNSTYYIVFYTDDGDGEFNHKEDAILTSNADTITAIQFQTF